MLRTRTYIYIYISVCVLMRVMFREGGKGGREASVWKKLRKNNEAEMCEGGKKGRINETLI